MGFFCCFSSHPSRQGQYRSQDDEYEKYDAQGYLRQDLSPGKFAKRDNFRADRLTNPNMMYSPESGFSRGEAYNSGGSLIASPNIHRDRGYRHMSPKYSGTSPFSYSDERSSTTTTLGESSDRDHGRLGPHNDGEGLRGSEDSEYSLPNIPRLRHESFNQWEVVAILGNNKTDSMQSKKSQLTTPDWTRESVELRANNSPYYVMSDEVAEMYQALTKVPMGTGDTGFNGGGGGSRSSSGSASGANASEGKCGKNGAGSNWEKRLTTLEIDSVMSEWDKARKSIHVNQLLKSTSGKASGRSNPHMGGNRRGGYQAPPVPPPPVVVIKSGSHSIQQHEPVEKNQHAQGRMVSLTAVAKDVQKKVSSTGSVLSDWDSKKGSAQARRRMGDRDSNRLSTFISPSSTVDPPPPELDVASATPDDGNLLFSAFNAAGPNSDSTPGPVTGVASSAFGAGPNEYHRQPHLSKDARQQQYSYAIPPMPDRPQTLNAAKSKAVNLIPTTSRFTYSGAVAAGKASTETLLSDQSEARGADSDDGTQCKSYAVTSNHSASASLESVTSSNSATSSLVSSSGGSTMCDSSEGNDTDADNLKSIMQPSQAQQARIPPPPLSAMDQGDIESSQQKQQQKVVKTGNIIPPRPQRVQTMLNPRQKYQIAQSTVFARSPLVNCSTLSDSEDSVSSPNSSGLSPMPVSPPPRARVRATAPHQFILQDLDTWALHRDDRNVPNISQAFSTSKGMGSRPQQQQQQQQHRNNRYGMQVGKSTVVSQEDDLGDEFSSERNGHRKNNSTKSVVAAPPNTADKEAKKARRMTSINQNSRRLSAVQT